ncbi:MAG: hypothetical protein K0S56_1664 [Microvirga sp.]|jgi:HAD superfamily hydrolase (TIGR01549 family)|nr:hypothetical protein [Microvirga sp.]
MTEIRAICFDAFGTLVEIADKRRPFQKLLSGMGQGSRAAELLTAALDMRSLTRNLAQDLYEDHLSQLEKDLQAECASVRLRPEIERIWGSLRQIHLRIGVCSNLALPYGFPLLSALPDAPDAIVFSYEVGLIKPDPAIFHLVCSRLELQPDQILFVGDTQLADIEGPRSIGMPATLISKFETYFAPQAGVVGSLPDDLIAAIEKSAGART